MVRILNKVVETIAEFVIPKCRLEDLWDLAQANPPYYAYQIADCTVRAIVDEAERALYPAIAIHRDLPAPEVKRKRLIELPRRLWKSIGIWMLGCTGYMFLNAQMMPDLGFLQGFAVALPSIVLALVIRLHWEGWGPELPAGPIAVTESMSAEAYRRELKRHKDMLLVGRFSPSKFPGRSGVVVLAVMLMFFPPSYVVLRWFAGDPLPSDLSWAAIVWRFAMSLIMFALFLCIRKSNDRAAEAFQQEIDALDPARTKSMSA
jgi:hypothetical protein